MVRRDLVFAIKHSLDAIFGRSDKTMARAHRGRG
jgi:hypothetical protein